MRIPLCTLLTAALLTVSCPKLALGGMSVGLTNSLVRIRPNDTAIGGKSIMLKTARNEYEPFQVVVRAEQAGLKDVQVQVSELRRDRRNRIAGSQLTLYREHYVEVKTPSPKSKDGTGWYPDALIPFVNPIDGQPLRNSRFQGAPFDVSPGADQPVWVDVFVPRDAAPGIYKGSVIVTALNEKKITLPVQLTVWDFTLPETPSMRANFGGFGNRVAGAEKVKAGSPEFRDLETRYADALAMHRICPLIPNYLYPRVNSDGTIEPGETHAALKQWMQRFHVTGFPLRLLGDDPCGKDRERNLTFLRATYRYLKENGWDKYAYIYVLDEPNDAAAYEQVRQRSKLIHEAERGIKVLCTEQPTPQEPAWGTLVGSVDIWVPLWTLFEEGPADERLAAGEELWSYTALCQGGKNRDTPYWEIDFPLLDYRIPAWMSWRYGITGLLYWTTVYWQKAGDVWTNPATYGEGRYAYNGEGSLFYPGAELGFSGPVASLRLKQIREGMEDYEYLKLLADSGQKADADELARKLAASWTEWNTEPAALYAAREEIARRLVGRKR